ncbi:TetR/AcrR family transcriptional regulator [Amycolatopsis aidingensis]|uniref:TetR/AcrR family transcriptional regulator n=1 Tax=Amycolatopsis aidingensis TaxID=2842453 RepID=UPI001C0E7D5A|nr:TetR/AcrR family transcriptional regulator [Amycolatopsis aidingensis]
MSSQQARPTRQRILDAAEQLMRNVGLAKVTTKEIAQAAVCSEAALYKHFVSKEELFVVVLQERLPPVGTLLAELTADPGGRSTVECLVDVAREVTEFYASTVPITASLFAEPALLRRHRDAMRALDKGPQKLLDALAGFLYAERRRGRIGPDADPDAAAAALLGACFQRAFLSHFWAVPDDSAALDAFARGVVRTVAEGIRPAL